LFKDDEIIDYGANVHVGTLSYNSMLSYFDQLSAQLSLINTIYTTPSISSTIINNTEIPSDQSGRVGLLSKEKDPSGPVGYKMN